MAKTYINGFPVTGSTSYASAVTYVDKDGNKSTVQEEIDKQNDNLGGLRFGVDGDGNGGYYKADDSFVPFKSGGPILVGLAIFGCGDGNYGTNTVVVDSNYVSVSDGGTSRTVTFTIKKDGKYRVTSTGAVRGTSSADGSIVVGGTTILSGKYNSDLQLNDVYSLTSGNTIVANSNSIGASGSFTAGTIAVSFEG